MKLVRDNIPDIIRKNNQIPITRILNDKEYEEAVNQKIIEEATEIIEAKTRDDILTELADSKEILLAKAALYNITDNDIEEERVKRASERGAFIKRVFLEEVKDA